MHAEFMRECMRDYMRDCMRDCMRDYMRDYISDRVLPSPPDRELIASLIRSLLLAS